MSIVRSTPTSAPIARSAAPVSTPARGVGVASSRGDSAARRGWRRPARRATPPTATAARAARARSPAARRERRDARGARADREQRRRDPLGRLAARHGLQRGSRRAAPGSATSHDSRDASRAREAARARGGQRRAVARDARDQRRRLREAEPRAPSRAPASSAARVAPARGRPARAPARPPAARRRASPACRAAARSAAPAPARRPPAAATAAASSAGPRARRGRGDEQQRERRARVQRDLQLLAPRAVPAGDLPAEQPRQRGDVPRRGDRHQLGRPVQQPERRAPRAQRGASAAGSPVASAASPAAPAAPADVEPERAEHDASPRPRSRRSGGCPSSPPSCRRPRGRSASASGSTACSRASSAP